MEHYSSIRYQGDTEIPATSLSPELLEELLRSGIQKKSRPKPPISALSTMEENENLP